MDFDDIDVDKITVRREREIRRERRKNERRIKADIRAQRRFKRSIQHFVEDE